MLEGLHSILFLQSFTIFPEYFIAISAIYLLIALVFISYNNYNILLERAVSECIGLILLMSCYLIINDEIMQLNFLTLNNSIANDYFSFFTKFVICFFSAAYFFLIADSLKQQKLSAFEYLIIVLFSVLGLMLLCSSNDLLTAYLAIELTSLSSYILASFKKSSNYSIEAGITYFITGAVSSAFFLLGSSILYALTGSIYLIDFWDLFTDSYETTLNLIAQTTFTELNLITDSTVLTQFNEFTLLTSIINFNFLEVGLTLILLSLFIKLALAPFHLWSLDVYEGSPTSSTFFFAVLTKLSIFIFLIRLCYVGLLAFVDCWQFYSVWIALFSIVVGSFGGLKQRKLKTLLAYSSTSHMGYSLLAFSSGHVFGIQILLFYLVIYMISGLCVWFIILLLRLKSNQIENKYTKELGDLALLNKSNAALSFGLAITMFSIAGIPPLIGFFAKMGIFLTLLKSEMFIIPLAAILCSIVSTFYYIRIIKVLYFENILVGKLCYPVKSNKTILLAILIFLLAFLFINPTLLYLIIFDVVNESFYFMDNFFRGY